MTVEMSADARKWAEIFAREHEAVLADQDNVQQFLVALTELTRTMGIELTATCDLRLERGDLTLLENIEWSSSNGYEGEIPEWIDTRQMAGFSFPNFMLALETTVQQLPSMQAFSADIKLGVPEAIEARYFAFITAGSATPTEGYMGGQIREVRATVTVGYRVGGDERSAELAIAQMVDELTAAVYADPTLGGTSDDPVTLDMGRADTPEYQGRAGSEVRTYPIGVIGHQQQEDV